MRTSTICSLVALMGAISMTRAFPLGAPLQSCISMMPQHYVDQNPAKGMHQPQDTEPFFSIHVEKEGNIAPGEQVLVTIKADEHYFEGFLIQARPMDEVSESNPVIYGTWSNITADAQPACDGWSAGTHSEHKHYDNVTMVWTAPYDKQLYDFHFTATVVKGFSTFFMDVRSRVFNPSGGWTEDASPATLPLTLTTLLMALSVTLVNVFKRF